MADSIRLRLRSSPWWSRWNRFFLSLFILMGQHGSGPPADQRNYLDLQINLLAEDEDTKIPQTLQPMRTQQAGDGKRPRYSHGEAHGNKDRYV